MNLRHACRPWPALALPLLAVALLAGCSKSTAPTPKTPPIPHADADDIVQVIATTMSANNGGWYATIKQLADSLSVPAPNLVAGGRNPYFSVPMTARLGLMNNFQMTYQTATCYMTYNFQAGWLNAAGVPSAHRDTSTHELQALVGLDGGIFASANGLIGTYGCHTYTVTSPTDSTYYATNLGIADQDTVEFSGFLDDSCFASVHSTITTSSSRWWFHDNFVEYTIRIPKPQLVSNPYPAAYQSEVVWTIEAKWLKSQDRNSWYADDIVEARMVFNGTSTATLTLADVIDAPDWTYLYRVDINTGVITRLN